MELCDTRRMAGNNFENYYYYSCGAGVAVALAYVLQPTARREYKSFVSICLVCGWRARECQRMAYAVPICTRKGTHTLSNMG